MDSLHVAMVLHRLDRRGIAQAVIDVSEGLVRKGVRVTLVATDAHDVVLEALPPAIDVRVAATRIDRTLFSVPQLARHLRSVAADLVVSHHNGPNRATVLARAMARLDVPHITVEHIHYTHHVPPAGRYPGPQWIRDRLTSSLYARADMIGGVSPDVVTDLVDRFGLQTKLTAVLPAPGRHVGLTDPAAIPPVDHPWYNESCRVICCVANISSRKAQHVLIGALPYIRQHAGDVRIVVVGRLDDSAYAAVLQRQISRLGLEGAVDLVGFQKDPTPWMAHADAFALTSNNEGCPRVLSEAMSVSVPIVATDAPSGPRFVLEAGRSGVVVPVGDSAAVGAALVQVLTDHTFAANLEEQGRRRAMDFTGDAIAERYLAAAATVMASA